jgi:endo-1,4-beta-xylanase
MNQKSNVIPIRPMIIRVTLFCMLLAACDSSIPVPTVTVPPTPSLIPPKSMPIHTTTPVSPTTTPTAMPTLAAPGLQGIAQPPSAIILSDVVGLSAKLHSKQTGDDFILGFDKNTTPLVIAIYNAAQQQWVWKRGVGLRDLADQAGIQIGVGIEARMFSQPKFFDVMKHDFNSAVLHSGIYWQNLEPVKGGDRQFYLAQDQIDDLRKHGIQSNVVIRGHPLIWAQDLPTWLVVGGYSKEELTTILKEHTIALVNQFKGTITQWVVVNEPYRKGDDFFEQGIGPEYVDIAFQAAREADPSAVLIFNDNRNETSGGVNTRQTKQIVTRLKSKGLVDGVGLQMHLFGEDPLNKKDMITTMQSYGVPVYITELDMSMANVTGTQEMRFAKQAQIYGDVLDACLKSGVCRSYTMWGVGDKYSWLEFYLNWANADGTIYDDELNAKPAYYELLRVLAKDLGATPINHIS